MIAPTPVRRDPAPANIVTETVVASASASSSTTTTSSSGGFPVAVAIPALVGGMVIAVLGAGLWWWISKRRRREKRRRWEAHQRRQQRKRANSAATRPSMSNNRTRTGGSTPKSPIEEKGPIPVLPVLPKDAYAQGGQQQAMGYNQYQEAHAYPVQPAIEHVEESSLPSEEPEPVAQKEEVRSNAPPPKPSRSTARVAAAENAAARDAADPMTRWRPNKPSPLALKAQQQKLAGGAQETLAPEGYHAPVSSGNTRATSGEWGVALGSPNNDGSFPPEVHYSLSAGAAQSGYAQDPYLSASNANRAPSGQYSHDPYAAYHDAPADVDYHAVAKEMDKRGGGGSWV